MRIIATIAFYWLGLSAAAVIAIARVLRVIPDRPKPPPPARSVDDWAPVAVDAEFWALIRDGVQR